MIVCQTDYIQPGDFSDKLVSPGHKKVDSGADDPVYGEKDEVLQALRACHNNVSKAAAALGISRPTLYKKMKQYHIEKNNQYE